MDETTMLTIIVGTIIGILLAAWLFSLVLGTSRMIKELKKQNQLLIQIALQQGVPPERIDKAVNSIEFAP
jgi:hypothetical protein